MYGQCGSTAGISTLGLPYIAYMSILAKDEVRYLDCIASETSSSLRMAVVPLLPSVIRETIYKSFSMVPLILTYNWHLRDPPQPNRTYKGDHG